MSSLRAVNLTKQFKGRQVVDDVSLHVESGEVVGLLGPNGAGKTTCFYMIVGLVRCDRGEIKLRNRDLTHAPMHARALAGLGYLPQEASVFRKLSVADNLVVVLQTRRDLNRRRQMQLKERLLEELQIGHLAGNLGISLSGGERRRVEIARALAMEPTFILLDEPLAGVDPLSVMDIQRIIDHLRRRGIGVLVTDHNVRETLGICARAYILSDGKVISEGAPEQVLKDADVRKVYLGEHFRL